MTAASGFTFEDGLGVVFRDDGRGCPVWYMAQDYDRAHDEAGDLQPRKTWVKTGRVDDARAEHDGWVRDAMDWAQGQLGRPYTWT